MQSKENKNFVVYRSSAGSGKTYTLVKEFLCLALANSNPNYYKNILAITFTNKAAAEMKERIFKFVFELASAIKDTPLLIDIANELNLPTKIIKQRAKLTSKHILHHYSYLHVGTIDSFTNSILKTFAKDLGLANDFEVALNTREYLELAVDDVMSKVGKEAELTKALVDFAKYKSNNDKSWNIQNDLNNIAKLLTKEGDIESIEKLKNISSEHFSTTIVKLRKEVKEIKEKLIDIGKKAIQIITSNGIEIYSFKNGQNGVGAFFERLNNDNLIEPTLAVKGYIEREEFYSKSAKVGVKSAIDSIKGELTPLFNQSVEYFSYYKLYSTMEMNIHQLSVLHKIKTSLVNKCTEHDVVLISDFNRLISNVTLNEPVPFIYERTGDRFGHFLVDEFQDTSILQWHNLLPLIDNGLAQNKKSLVVGDAKQAIYRFRNGEAEQIVKLPYLLGDKTDITAEREQTLIRNYQEANLATNWRSAKNVIEFNNTFFENAKTHIKEGFDAIYNETEQKCTENKGQGYVEINRIVKTDNEQYIEETFAKCIEIIEENTDQSKANKGFGNIAILVRNKKSGSLIAQHLIEKNIPVISGDSLLLHTSKAVSFIINLLSYCYNSKNVYAGIQCINYVLENSEETHRNHDVISKYIERIKKTKTLHLFPFFKDWKFNIEKLKILTLPLSEAIEYIMQVFKLSSTEVAYLQLLMDSVYELENSDVLTLSDFLTWWENTGSEKSISTPSNIDAVIIMTIHKSKGLQFPIVISPFIDWRFMTFTNDPTWVNFEEEVMGFHSFLLPFNTLPKCGFETQHNIEIAKNRMENINMLYVSFTRAANKLFIISEMDTRSKKNGNSRINQLFDIVLNEMGYDLNETPICIGDKNEKLTIENEHNPTLTLQNIEPIGWRNRVMISDNLPSEWDVDSPLKKQGFGTVLHNIMAKLAYVEDTDVVFEHISHNAQLSADEKDEVKKNIRGLLEHTIAKKWFTASTENKIEKSIISSDGIVYRPDRVCIDGETTYLIDYKTGKKSETHQSQLLGYSHLLEEMGYKNIKPYLVYMNKGNNEVVEIS